jgi:glycosyltransferase involved in cell wall biosynthesis
MDLFGLPPESLDLIYNGTDHAPATASREATRAELFAALGWPADTTLVLSIGRLAPQKGFDLLARIAPAVLQTHPRVRFVVAGEGPQREELQELVHRHGIHAQFALLGHRADVAALLRAADVFVLPSRYEGHSFALIEAMSAGLPIVASDASGIPEAVTDGHSGMLFPSEDLSALLVALRQTLDQETHWHMIGAAAMQAAERFCRTRMLDETFALFSDMAATTPRSTPAPRRRTTDDRA